jgi:hypothetical protein
MPLCAIDTEVANQQGRVAAASAACRWFCPFAIGKAFGLADATQIPET